MIAGGLAIPFINSDDFISNDIDVMVLGGYIFAGHGLKKRMKAAVENARLGE